MAPRWKQKLTQARHGQRHGQRKRALPETAWSESDDGSSSEEDAACEADGGLEKLMLATEWGPPPLGRGPDAPSRLHEQLARLAKLAAADATDLSERQGALSRCASVVLDVFPDARISLFGSAATGLALPGSDLDLSVVCPELPVPTFKPATLRPLHKLARRLTATGVARAGSCEVVPAKVPLVKLVESETGASRLEPFRAAMHRGDAAT
jgi:hypothetical protein